MLDASKILNFLEVNKITLDEETIEAIKYNNTLSYNNLSIVLDAIIEEIGDIQGSIIEPFEAIIQTYHHKLTESEEAYAELERKINENLLEEPEENDGYEEGLRNEIERLMIENKKQAEELEKLGYQLYAKELEEQRSDEIEARLHALTIEFNKLCNHRDILFSIIETFLYKD